MSIENNPKCTAYNFFFRGQAAENFRPARLNYNLYLPKIHKAVSQR